MIHNNFYKILGVNAAADNETIRKAYRVLARANHPDFGGDKDKFAEIALAYAAVRDAAMRERLRARWALFHTLCAVCGGDGVTTEQVTFTLVNHKTCSWCEGAGFV